MSSASSPDAFVPRYVVLEQSRLEWYNRAADQSHKVHAADRRLRMTVLLGLMAADLVRLLE